MRMSRMLMPTLKEVPSDAEITSHQLMLRAGMIRKMASGIYNQLPMGIRVFRKVEDIIREEMNAKGAQEISCALLVPAELWQESGRWDVMGPEMFRLKDRNGRDYCLGPTHEETFTHIVRNEITSYKQLPLNLYQIETKFRDERRPRFGVMRTRNFTMKDAYSFDADQEGLDKSYDDMFDAYTRIFARCELDNSPVQADSGAMGGSASAEFMVKSEVGEDEIVFCSGCDYAANIEKATSVNHKASTEEMKEMSEIETPNVHTIEELQDFFKMDAGQFAKTLIYYADGKTVAVVVRGDRDVNETKVANAIGGAVEFELASEDTIKAVTGAEVGFAGPIGIKADYLFIDQEVVDQRNVIVGANKTGYHIQNANFGRDFEGQVGDFRNVQEGDKCPKCGQPLEIMRGVEVGHIFKLGTKYSESMGATFLDQNGKSQPIIMGCYGIGVSRTLAALYEHCLINDSKWGPCGFSLPEEIAPYKIQIVPKMDNEEKVKQGNELYQLLNKEGIGCILDDRENLNIGAKIKDCKVLGTPYLVVLGDKAKENEFEIESIKTGEKEIYTLEELIKRFK